MAGIIVVVALANRATAQADDQPELINKIYEVGDLLQPPPLLSDSESSSGTPNRFFNGGAAAGGGGFMRIPSQILPQFGGGMGGGGMGGGGMGGLGGGMGMGGPIPGPEPTLTAEALSALITDHVAPNTWLALGGDGDLTIIGSSMVISQTAGTHEKVEQFLELLRKARGSSVSVDIDIRVVEVAVDSALDQLTKSEENLAEIASDPSAGKLRLRCSNRQIASMSSGLKRSYIVSITPVVGGDSKTMADAHIAYQPVSESVLLGMRGKVQPIIPSDGTSGRIHLGVSIASGPEEVLKAEFGTGQSIDRLELEMATLETSIETEPDRWTLAGTIAVSDPTSSITGGEALPHLLVLVKWKPTETSR
ncbi:MAG: hypothetical protein AAF802_18185 [Planctomycetota bacterium]